MKKKKSHLDFSFCCLLIQWLYKVCRIHCYSPQQFLLYLSAFQGEFKFDCVAFIKFHLLLLEFIEIIQTGQFEIQILNAIDGQCDVEAALTVREDEIKGDRVREWEKGADGS